MFWHVKAGAFKVARIVDAELLIAMAAMTSDAAATDDVTVVVYTTNAFA